MQIADPFRTKKAVDHLTHPLFNSSIQKWGAAEVSRSDSGDYCLHVGQEFF